nr:methyltransferase domain-containing protein [Ammoniphilus resinae]
MEDAPYDQWMEYFMQTTKRYGGSVQQVIDLACGTGTISIELARRGYEVTSIDLSDDMLAVTYDKAQQSGVNVQLLCQDMREFIVPSSADAVVCFCDSLSYLTTPLDVEQTFCHVWQALKPGGIFLFDVHSVYKIQAFYGDQTFALADSDISYIWQCDWDGASQVTHELTFFVQEGGYYKRFEEVHQQRGYTVEEIEHWLRKAGFDHIMCTADFTDEPPRETSERLFFTAMKQDESNKVSFSSCS